MLNVIGSDVFRHFSARAGCMLGRRYSVCFVCHSNSASLAITHPVQMCGFSIELAAYCQRIFDKWTGMATGNYGNYSNDFEQKTTKKRREKFSLAGQQNRQREQNTNVSIHIPKHDKIHSNKWVWWYRANNCDMMCAVEQYAHIVYASSV